MRLFYLLLFLPLSIFAQQTPPTEKGWQELTIADGLSQGMIYDLKQDRKGFIWVTTKDGLNRYDGHNFTVFTHDPYNEYSLSGDDCSALLIDQKGRLWVGTLSQGLNLYDDKTQRFYHIAISDQSVANANNYEIRGLEEDPDGNIWIGTSVGKPFKVKLPASLQQGFPEQADFTKQVQVTSLPLRSGNSEQPNFCFSFRANGQAITGTKNGVYSFNWRNPTSLAKLDLVDNEPLELFDAYEDVKHDFLFVSTGNKINCLHRGSKKTIVLSPNTPVGLQIRAVAPNTLAITSASHIWLLSPTELFNKDSLTVADAFVALPPNVYAIASLLKDQTGSIWVGTSGYGLRKFNPQIKQFRAYLPNTTLTYLYVDRQDRTYVRHEFSYALLDKVSNQRIPFLSSKLPEADRRQRYLMQDRQGFFWVSNTNFQTHEMSLFKFSTDWQLLKKYPLPAGITFGFVGNQTLEAKDGTLWIGATNGKLLRFNPQTETFQILSYQSLLPQSGAEIETYALLQEPDGTLWIGTQRGLVKAQNLLTKPLFSLHKNSTIDRQSLSNNFVSSLANDPHNPARYLWVGTKGGGLERLDKQTGRFDHFTQAQGLPNKVVYGMLVDEFKNLWLSTNRGLAQFNPKTYKFRNYTKADGLQDDEFNTSSFFKSATGELLFGGVNGLTAFRASEVSAPDPQLPQVNIIGLKVNNRSIAVGGPDGILSQGIEYTQQLELSHEQNLLTFEFGVMNFTNSAKNQYRHRLEGVDDRWVDAGTNRFANYTQLPPGRYQFQMMGSVDGEIWSKPVTLGIWVRPPVYQTWWAYLLYIVIVLVVSWQLYRFQTQRLLLQQQVKFEQKEASRLAELDTLKTQFFTNISHEFRTPLTLILGPLTDMKQRFPGEQLVELMERNGQRLLGLINQLLDLSKLEAGQLKPEPQPGDMSAFFRTLASSFSSLAESRTIDFRFSQNEPGVWANFDRDKIEKIVTNLLANAFKFTPAGKAVTMEVLYQLQQTNNTLVITVMDTGIGIAPANLAHIFERFYQGSAEARSADTDDGQMNRVGGPRVGGPRTYEGTGIGLALVKELIAVLGGTIDAQSTEGVGSTFTVTLPMMLTTPPLVPPATPIIDLVAQHVASQGMELLVDSPITQARQTARSGPQWHEQQPALPEKLLLIIDDNADIRTYVRSVFAADFQIIEATNGRDGLAKATEMMPNMVICDLMMPQLDGFGFCRALKMGEATSHIPVVMLTAKATINDRIEGFELGADDYLTKPFNRGEIRARVHNLIQQRERLSRYFREQLGLAQPIGEVVLSKEGAFLQKARGIVLDQLTNSKFDVEQFSEALSMSQRQVVRKLKALTDQTAVEFIRNLRLEQAAEKLRQGKTSVADVAYEVGFESLPYFTKMFQEKFGVLPSAYSQQKENTR